MHADQGHRPSSALQGRTRVWLIVTGPDIVIAMSRGRLSLVATASSLYVGALALVFAAPELWLKFVAAGILASGPLAAALIQGLEIRVGPERSTVAIVTSVAIAAAATALAVAMVVIHPARLFRAATPVPEARTWDGIAQPLGVPGHWDLKLDSRFNGSSLDTHLWQPGWYGTGITPPANFREADCYSSKNVGFPGDGSMHLAITPEPSECDGQTHPYTGAIVTSNPANRRHGDGFQYTFGALQARVYLPADGSLIANWPAVWTIGRHWPTDGEDDIAEGLFGSVCFHFHSPGHATHGPGACAPRIQAGWHTFASVWRPGSVTYYYDGLRVGEITIGVTDKPMFIVLDNTVWRDQPGTTRPASMRVAYVRVWQEATPRSAHNAP